MPSARRFVIASLVACALGLNTAGCATSATAAATVGGYSISEESIFDRTSALAQQVQAAGNTAPSPAALADLNRSQTTSAIRSRLLEVAAQDQGVVVTEEQVNTALAGASATDVTSQLGAPQTLVAQTVRDLLRLQGLVSQQAAQGVAITNVTVRIDGVSVPTREQAVAMRSQFLADPGGVGAIIAASASPVPAQTRSILTDPSAGPTGVFNAAEGEVLLYPSSDGYYVVRVVQRKVAPAVLTVQDLQNQRIAGQFDLGALLLEPYAQQAGVSVNPRLGVWDPLSLQVVPGGSGL